MRKNRMSNICCCILLCLIGVIGRAWAAGNVTVQTLAVNGAWSTAQLSTDTDAARFVLTVPESGEVTLRFQSSMECAMVCSLIDEKTGTTYYRRQCGGGGQTNPVTCQQIFSLSAGQYVAVIQSYGAALQTAGEVACQAAWTPYEIDETEPNNSFAQATWLEEEKSVGGCFTMTDTEDFYQLSLKESGTLRLSVTEEQTDCGNVLLWLYDGDHVSKISQKKLSAQGQTQTVELELDAGEYYIRLQPCDAVYRFFSYRLQWERIEETEPEPEPDPQPVRPERVVILSAKNGLVYSRTKRYVTLKWEEADGAEGYQVMVSSRKKSGYSLYKATVKTTIKMKRRRGTTCYFKVRAYSIQEDGSILYGKYSKPKKLRVKK